MLDAVAGYYGSYGAVSKVVRNGDGSITLSQYGPGGWTTVAANLRLREDGWFAAEDSPRSFRLVDSGPWTPFPRH